RSMTMRARSARSAAMGPWTGTRRIPASGPGTGGAAQTLEHGAGKLWPPGGNAHHGALDQVGRGQDGLAGQAQAFGHGIRLGAPGGLPHARQHRVGDRAAGDLVAEELRILEAEQGPEAQQDRDPAVLDAIEELAEQIEV